MVNFQHFFEVFLWSLESISLEGKKKDGVCCVVQKLLQMEYSGLSTHFLISYTHLWINTSNNMIYLPAACI